MKRRIVALLALATCAGCLGKTDPVPVEHIRPLEVVAPGDVAAGGSAAARPALRLREVSAADYLREPVFWTWDDVGGYRDDLQWTERPAAYLESALSRALFLERGLRRATGGGEAGLDARLRRFDVVSGPQRRAEVEVDVLVTDDRGLSLVERRFREEEPLAGVTGEEVAAAMGRALARAVGRAADAAVEALGGR